MQQIYTCLKVIFSQIQIQSETLSISQFQLCPSPRAIRASTHVSGVGHFQFYRCPWVGNLPIPGMTPGHLTPLPFWSSTWHKTETWFLFWFRQCAVHTLRGRSRAWDKPGHLIKKFVSTREFVKLKQRDWPGMGMGTAGKHCCNSTLEGARWFGNKWNTQNSLTRDGVPWTLWPLGKRQCKTEITWFIKNVHWLMLNLKNVLFYVKTKPRTTYQLPL